MYQFNKVRFTCGIDMTSNKIEKLDKIVIAVYVTHGDKSRKC